MWVVKISFSTSILKEHKREISLSIVWLLIYCFPRQTHHYHQHHTTHSHTHAPTRREATEESGEDTDRSRSPRSRSPSPGHTRTTEWVAGHTSSHDTRHVTTTTTRDKDVVISKWYIWINVCTMYGWSSIGNDTIIIISSHMYCSFKCIEIWNRTLCNMWIFLLCITVVIQRTVTSSRYRRWCWRWDVQRHRYRRVMRYWRAGQTRAGITEVSSC